MIASRKERTKYKTMKKEKPEDIVLRYSKRGMTVLREAMQNDYCLESAQEILSWKKGTVFLTTGFYVAGFAETDGPAGTVMLAKALQVLGYRPVIVTDSYCKDFFEPEEIEVLYLELCADETDCRRLLERYRPVGLISVERCGKNTQNDYANMRGVSIAAHTAPADLLFELASGTIPTIGIGDGGNEIGMGNAADLIAEKLSLVPCKVCVDKLVIATVSNWGAYAVIAYLKQLTGAGVFPSFSQIYDYIDKTVRLGSVDGVLKEHAISVDGFGMDVEKEIVEALAAAIRP